MESEKTVCRRSSRGGRTRTKRKVKRISARKPRVSQTQIKNPRTPQKERKKAGGARTLRLRRQLRKSRVWPHLLRMAQPGVINGRLRALILGAIPPYPRVKIVIKGRPNDFR